MPLLLILLPLVNFLLLTLTSSRVHWRQLIALVLVSKSLVLGWSAANFEKMILGETHVTKIGEWFDFGLLNVSWTFSIDPLTHIMLFTVTLVSTLVHTYSTAYMSEDPHLPRFLSYLSLFTFFMLLLISADNFVNLFLGWEGVGLCSYLLISFWFTRIQANKAALQAMIVNRIADLALTIGMLTVFYVFQTTEFNVVFGLAQYLSKETSILLFGNGFLSTSVCTTLLFLGAMGKSAQIGLHTWLPQAMEGIAFVGPSIIKKIPPYAGTATFTTLIVRPPSRTNEKFNVAAANPQETSSTVLGSSETLRGTATNFNFTLFRSGGRYLTADLEWLLGFAEGGGSFLVNNDGSVRFQITQSVVDVQVLHRVRKILGFGEVRVQDRNKPFPTWKYGTQKREDLRRLIHLFNGNLVLEKSQLRFSAFVTAFNARYKEEISLLPELITPSLTTGWLSGFTDAEGCFTVLVLNPPTGRPSVRARFILAQKGAEKELRAFATLLSGKLSLQRSYGGYNLSVQWTYLKKTVHYFRRFPLKTKKRISLIKFLTIYRLLTSSKEQKRPLSEKELILIRKRAKEINPDWRVVWKASTSKVELDKIETVVEDKVRSIK